MQPIDVTLATWPLCCCCCGRCPYLPATNPIDSPDTGWRPSAQLQLLNQLGLQSTCFDLLFAQHAVQQVHNKSKVYSKCIISCTTNGGLAGASWIKKWQNKGRSCNVPTDRLKFPTKEIMGAQNFNYIPKFPRNERFSPRFCIFGKTFSHKSKIFWKANIFGAILPLPRRHC